MLKPLFSICIPIYNQIKYLSKCLETIENQTFENFEVIMIDDGSIDGSDIICKKYCEKDYRFKYYYYKNSGVSVTRNRLLEKVNGKYIIMIDPDDYIDKEMLKNLNKKINENKKIDVIRFKAIVVNDLPEKNIYRFNFEKKIKFGIDGVEALKNWSLEKNRKYAVPWLYCIKSQLYNNIEFPVNRVHEDFAIYPIILARAHNVVTLDKICYYYVQHSNSLMNKKNINQKLKKLEDWIINYYNLKNSLEDIFKSKNINDEIKKIIYDDLLRRTILIIEKYK